MSVRLTFVGISRLTRTFERAQLFSSRIRTSIVVARTRDAISAAPGLRNISGGEVRAEPEDDGEEQRQHEEGAGNCVQTGSARGMEGGRNAWWRGESGVKRCQIFRR